MTDKPGCLYVAATPIGNLNDITDRLRQTLSAADIIVCEDTRVSKKLCFHLEIKKPLISLHDANEAEASSGIVNKIQAGQTAVLISDAGTPAVSDPGARLVDLCHRQGIAISPIAGPSAVTSAMSVSGFAGGFTFLGFLPRSGSARKKALQFISDAEQAVLFFESPNRVENTLTDLAAYIDKDRQLLIARELSKLHEDIARRPLGAWLDSPPTRKGEFTIAVAPRPPVGKNELLVHRYHFYKRAGAVEEQQIFDLLAYEFDLSPKRVRYKLESLLPTK